MKRNYLKQRKLRIKCNEEKLIVSENMGAPGLFVQVIDDFGNAYITLTRKQQSRLLKFLKGLG